MAGSNLAMLSITGNNTESDECYTPIEALKPLLVVLPTTLMFSKGN